MIVQEQEEQEDSPPGAPREPGCDRLYGLGSAAAAAQTLARVRAEVPTREVAAGKKRTYYDTFDRRLAARGCILCLMDEGEGRALRWERLSGELVRRLVTSKLPGFARDLPQGSFRDALEPLIDVRKLLPVARASGRATRVCVLDKDGKTTARLGVENWSVAATAGKQKSLFVRLSPVRGYARAEKRILKLLEGELGLRPLAESALAELLGLSASDEDRVDAWPPRLLPGMRADEAAKTIYKGLLATMLANEDGARRRVDPEFLHQYRVALRRARAGLSRLRDVLPQSQVDRFKRDFAWLGQMTGPVRDNDVHLSEIPTYRSALPEEERQHLDPLHRWLETQGRSAQDTLVRALGSERYARLVKAWSAVLAKAPPARTGLKDAARPVEDVARERIWRLHKRIVKRGRQIEDETPAEVVHELRLDSKKLRYLMEFFRRLFPNKAIKHQIAELKALQEVLGTFNDCEVQQASLRRMTLEMASGGDAPLDSVLVMGRLVEALRVRQEAARSEISGRVAVFTRPKNLARAKRLFAPRPREQDA